MREETIHTVNLLEKRFEIIKDPKGNFPKDYFEKVEKAADKVIGIFEEEKMTYEDAYATLNFVYEALKFKSQKVNL